MAESQKPLRTQQGTMTASPDPAPLDRQRPHWSATFANHADMFGTDPSQAAIAAADRFAEAGLTSVLELGAGQGRDTLYLARRGLQVTALDYALGAVQTLAAKVEHAGLADLIEASCHDVRQPLPAGDASFDACYSHMLFCMALTVAELQRLAAEVRRVVRPDGLVVYTARTTADAHYGTGIPRGEDMFEHGGFIVHFFGPDLIQRLAAGFDLVEITEFTEGDLPRRLVRVTMRVPDRRPF